MQASRLGACAGLSLGCGALAWGCGGEIGAQTNVRQEDAAVNGPESQDSEAVVNVADGVDLVPDWRYCGTGDASIDNLTWVTGVPPYGDCAELAPMNLPSLADAVASPGAQVTLCVRKRLPPYMIGTPWFWQTSELTIVNEPWESVESIPIDAAGTYRVRVHTHIGLT